MNTSALFRHRIGIHVWHDLQTSNAVGAAASQLGSDAHAMLALMNKELGLSQGKCAPFIRRCVV